MKEVYYNRYRYYEPHSARYIGKDPIGLNGGMNTSAYVSVPISYTDSKGLACDQRGCWVTAQELLCLNVGNYRGYYTAACGSGDPYACRALEVSTNTGGLMTGVTNTRLSYSISNNLSVGKSCKSSKEEIERRMEMIRVGLANAHAKSLNAKGSINDGLKLEVRHKPPN